MRTGGFLGQELKFYDTSLSNATISAPTDASGGELDPSATVVFNSVDQGDGEQQRDGRRITMKSLYINGTITVGAQSGQSAADEPAHIYLAVVLDTQTNGATIVSEEVFENQSGVAGLASSPMRNLQYVDRFKVLGSKKLTLQSPNMANDTGATGGVIQAGIMRPFKFYVNLKDVVVTYKGTTASVANITDNSIHLIGYTSNTTLAPKMNYNARLRFMG